MRSRLSVLAAVLAAVTAFCAPASAAVVTYRFTASTNLVQIVSSGLAPNAYAVQGSLLQTISGVITYESAVDPLPGSSSDTAVYVTPVTISLDQFDTTTPSSPTTQLFIVNDPNGYTFAARDVTPAPDPADPFKDAVWFRFGAGPGTFTSLALPTTLTLSDFVFGSVTLVTRDSVTGARNFANFLIDTLTPVDTVPLPAAPVLFASGLIALVSVRKRKRAAA